MTLFVELLSGVLDTYLLYLFASGFYAQYRRDKSSRNFWLLGLYIVLLSCAPLLGVYRMLLCWAGIAVFLQATYVSKVSKALIAATGFVTLSVVVDTICEYPFFFLHGSLDIIFVEGLARCIYIIFAKLVGSLLLVILIALFGRRGLLDIPFRDLWPLATCQLVSAFICIVSLELIDKVSYFFLMLLTFSVLGILYINIVFFVYMRSIRMNYENERRKQLAEQQLQTQIAYYQQLRQAQEQTRRMWHDIQKQLSAVTALMESGQPAQAARSLDQISESFHDVCQVVDVDHPVAGAILNEGLRKASALGIELKMDVFLSPSAAVSPLDLSVILGNTLDNAIEACANIQDPAVPKTIELSLRQKDSLLFYRISNPCDARAARPKRPGVHGYGLQNVAACVSRNGGTFRTEPGEERYTVEILLNLSQSDAAPL